MSQQDAVQAANDLITGSGGPPAFRFTERGVTAKGTITKIGSEQARDFASRQPKFYADGNPIMQAVIAICTEDGEEFRLFVRQKMKLAIQEALKAVDAKGLEIGGTLAVQYSGDEPSQQPSLSPTKLFTAQYKPPAAPIESNNLL